MPIEEEVIRIEAISLGMVQKVRLLHDRPWIPQDVGQALCACEQVRRW